MKMTAVGSKKDLFLPSPSSSVTVFYRDGRRNVPRKSFLFVGVIVGF